MYLHDANKSVNGYPMPFTNKEPVLGERKISLAHNKPINVGDKLTGVFAGKEENLHSGTVYIVLKVNEKRDLKGVGHDSVALFYSLDCVVSNE